MSIQHLVTVYCDRDWAQFCLQVESLRFVVNPITHWVIVNEAGDIDRYTALIGDLYRGLAHKVIVVARPKTISKVGWDNQQYYKLWIWRQIQNAYLILDCKNFFIRDCTLDDFQGLHGPDNFGDYLRDDNTFRPTLHYYAQQLGIEVRARQLSCQTPFLIEPAVMQHLDLELFERSFAVVSPSEFLYYSLWMQRMGMELKTSGKPWFRTIWPHETIEDFEFETNIPYTVLGLHRNWLSRDPENCRRANQWLALRGFKYRL